MADIDMRYDHPAYQVRQTANAESASHGAGNVHTALRFAAFTDMLVKSYTIKPMTAGTIANVFTAYKLTGTTTTTQVVTTFGSAATGGTNVVGTFSLARGDLLSVVNAGTDATGVFGITAEMTLVPRAAVTS